MEIAIVLALLVFAIVLFWKELFSVDITTLLLLMALIILGILTPDEAFSGFSTDIIIILASVFIMSGALQRTGLVDALGGLLLRFSGKSEGWLLFLMMALVGTVSAFMNNTTITALFIAPVIGLAKKKKINPSRLLMPLAFASILGGTCTLIGTSTNVAVSGYIKNVGLEPIGLFEITPVGLIFLGTGIAYMMLVGRRLVPDYKDESLTKEYEIREYLSEIIVLENSHLIGQRVFESDLAKMEFQILAIIRGKKKMIPTRSMRIQMGDILIVKGKVEDLLKVKKTAGIEIKPEFKLDDPALQSEDIKIAEVLIPPNSDLIGCTLKESDFRQKYGLTALALYRHGHSLREKIRTVHLRMGDLLLVQGPPDRIAQVKAGSNISLLEELDPSLYRKRKGLVVMTLFGIAILIGGMGWLPLSVTILGAAIGTILTKCIRVEEAYEFIDWRLLILIGGMTAFGTAMQKTGAAEWLAHNIVYFLGPLGPRGVMAGFFILTIFLTQPMSNAAAALVVLPVAMSAAYEMGVDQRSFAISIMLAASVSLITPLEPSCILVYGPGKYRFSDFVKNGLGLTVILCVLIYFLVPAFWPFYPDKKNVITPASIAQPAVNGR
ncbi:MAG: SLC13/DASS family transporter [Verrucomicrobia bacterium]|nr:SLC13/DASS family transporter [Verrucomicrobiota bacterium]